MLEKEAFFGADWDSVTLFKLARLILPASLAVALTACQTTAPPAPETAASRPATTNAPLPSAAPKGPIAPAPAPHPSATAAATNRTTTATSPGPKGTAIPSGSALEQKGGPQMTSRPPPAPQPPKITYDPIHDAQIKKVLKYAGESRWEAAQQLADQLYREDPHDPALQRLHDWVSTEAEKIRSQALENKIRAISANNSVFNPTIPRLLTESKDRGLPPRKDVRDAVQQIESTPYIPPSYGKTIEEKGPLFEMNTQQGRMQKILDKKITVHLDNVSLSDIIFQVGKAAGINFVADKSLSALKQTLSVNLDQVPLSELLHYIERNFQLQFQVGSNLVWITNGKDKSKQMEVTRFYRLKKGFILPAEFGPTHTTRVTVTKKDGTRVVTENEKIQKFVNDTTALKPSIETAINEFFDGTYMIDYERNLIVARGTPEQLDVLEKIIKEFDKPLQQVLIEARFITVSQSAFMQLGASWETGRSPLAGGRTAQDFTGLTKNFGDNGLSDIGLGLQVTFTNILNRKDLSATISALEQSGESETLSAPRLTLVNNLPGVISDGLIQYYYEQYTVKQQVTDRSVASSLVPEGKPTSITAGVTLKVLASIGGDGKSILLALNPEVDSGVRLVNFATVTDRNDQGQVVSTFDIKLPESRTQKLATRVVVKSGQTVVMGGVLERNQTTYVESVPGLGNLPIIGALFRKRTEIDSPRYLLIFVTATILSDSGKFITYDQGK